MIRLVYASPRSLSDLTARTNWGTSTVLSTPPASRMYMLFGNWLAMLNMSACRVLLPNRKASSISRKKPSTRDRAVPDAITAPAEISRETGGAGSAESASSAGGTVGRVTVSSSVLGEEGFEVEVSDIADPGGRLGRGGDVVVGRTRRGPGAVSRWC